MPPMYGACVNDTVVLHSGTSTFVVSWKSTRNGQTSAGLKLRRTGSAGSTSSSTASLQNGMAVHVRPLSPIVVRAVTRGCVANRRYALVQREADEYLFEDEEGKRYLKGFTMEMEAALFIKEKIDPQLERWQLGFHWKLQWNWEILARCFVHKDTGQRVFHKYGRAIGVASAAMTRCACGLAGRKPWWRNLYEPRRKSCAR